MVDGIRLGLEKVQYFIKTFDKWWKHTVHKAKAPQL